MLFKKHYRAIERSILHRNAFSFGRINKVYGQLEHDNEYHVYTGNDYGNDRLLVLRNGRVQYFNPEQINKRTTRVQNIIRKLYDVSKWENKEQ